MAQHEDILNMSNMIWLAVIETHDAAFGVGIKKERKKKNWQLQTVPVSVSLNSVSSPFV